MNSFEIEVTVAEEHLDDLNHVNNVQYLEWVQEVSKAHWQNLSHGQWDSDFIWVVRNHNITYHRPALLGENLLIGTHIKTTTGAKSERHVHIVHKDTHKTVVSCDTLWVLLDAHTSKPVRIPEEMIHALGAGFQK